MSNQKIIAIIIGVLLITGAIFYFFTKSPKIKNYPSTGTTIVAFGDSLVQGVGATEGNDFVTLLSQKIGQPIINMGVSGNTSAQGLARVEEVIAQNPKVVLVLLGGNDFLRHVPLAETFTNIDDIVVKLQNSGAVVVLLGVKGGIVSDAYKSHFKDIAKKRGALYVPNVLDGLLTNNEFMSDGIHPNDLGHNRIADKILPTLKKAL